MLNNKNECQKQKNDLVFKLLKSMNPYMPNISQNSNIRQQLQSIIQSQAANIIYEQDSEEDGSGEEGEGEGEEGGVIGLRKCQRDFVRRIVSRVVQVTIGGHDVGGMEDQLMWELEAQRQSRIVRKQLQHIQKGTYKQFKIPHNPISSSSYSSQQPSRLSSPSHPTNPPPYIPNTNTNTSNPITILTNPTTISHIKTHRQFNRQNKWNGNSNRSSKSRFEGIDQKFSGFRLELSKLDLGAKTYRYETDRPTTANHYENQIASTRSKCQSNELLLQSRIKQSPKLQKSHSESKIPQKTPNSSLNHSNTPYHSLSKSTKILHIPSPSSSQLFSKPTTTSTAISSSRKNSQKIKKESSKLDVQIIDSLLWRKIRDRDSTHTIAHLIK